MVSAAVDLKTEPQHGHLLMLSVDERDNNGRATIIYEDATVDVWTSSDHLQSILAAAAYGRLPVRNIDFDRKTMEMGRGAIDISLSSEG